MQTFRFCVEVDCNLSSRTSPASGVIYSEEIYKDNGFIILPDNYSEKGTPTRMVINCHGAGGTVTTNDSATEQQTLTQYLVANGYAVMDVNGLPSKFAEKNGIDLRNNIGSPIAIDSYVKAYHYCVQTFNLHREVFVHGGSMGGISSTNLVLSGRIPVIAHSSFCPVLDTYNAIFLHPWCDGLPKYALGMIYGLDKDENGEFIYNEEKVIGFNPATNPKIEKYPVPVKFWHCEDDDVVDFSVTQKFIDKIIASGGHASLQAFPHGGHEPQLVGGHIKNPRGNVILNQTILEITPAVEGVFTWIKQFDY